MTMSLPYQQLIERRPDGIEPFFFGGGGLWWWTDLRIPARNQEIEHSIGISEARGAQGWIWFDQRCTGAGGLRWYPNGEAPV